MPEPSAPAEKTPTTDEPSGATPPTATAATGTGATAEPEIGGSRREQLQSRIVVALILVGVLAAFFWPKAEFAAAPWGEVETADGSTVDLAAVAEPVTLVHFWATWCIPCLDEVPRILRLERDRDDVSVMMIAVGDHVPDVEKFLAERAGGAPSYYDPKWVVTKEWATQKLPETHLVVDGHIVDTFVGATEWDDAAIRRRVANGISRYRAGLEKG